MSVFRRASQRRGTPADVLVVGLGNPGREFAGTRHNVGADVVELLARRQSIELKPTRQKSVAAETTISGRRVVLAVPLTYVNLSGEAVSALVKRHGVDEPSRVIIVHDELDLDVGRMKVKAGGGLAGHNGLTSVREHLGSADFVRVRVGVGKPPSAATGAKWVLGRPSATDRETLGVMTERAADAVEAIIADGVEAAMTRHNT